MVKKSASENRRVSFGNAFVVTYTSLDSVDVAEPAQYKENCLERLDKEGDLVLAEVLLRVERSELKRRGRCATAIVCSKNLETLPALTMSKIWQRRRPSEDFMGWAQSV